MQSKPSIGLPQSCARWPTSGSAFKIHNPSAEGLPMVALSMAAIRARMAPRLSKTSDLIGSGQP